MTFAPASRLPQEYIPDDAPAATKKDDCEACHKAPATRSFYWRGENKMVCGSCWPICRDAALRAGVR